MTSTRVERLRAAADKNIAAAVRLREAGCEEIAEARMRLGMKLAQRATAIASKNP